MPCPGYSVSDIVILIDALIKLIYVFKAAPEAYRSIVESVEFGKDLLQALNRKLDDAPETFHQSEIQLLNRAVDLYRSVIQEFERLANDYPSLLNGSIWSRIKFLTREHFKKDVTKLEQSVQRAQSTVQTTLGVLHLSLLLQQSSQEKRTIYVVVNNASKQGEQSQTKEESSASVAPISSPSRLQSVCSTATLQSPGWVTEPMALHGEMKIWFKIGDEQTYRLIQSISIQWSPKAMQKQIEIIYQGKNKMEFRLVHRGEAATILQETLVPQMGRQTSYLKKLDNKVEYVVRFLKHHQIVQSKGTILSPSCLEYSFADERDFKKFQSLLRGRVNKFNILIERIYTNQGYVANKQVLQVWCSTSPDGQKTYSIGFFDNYKQRYEFAEVVICPSKKEKDDRLILAPKSSAAIGFSLGPMEILFYSGKDKDDFKMAAGLPNG